MEVPRFTCVLGTPTKSRRENLVNTEHFIIELFCRVDDQMLGVGKHTQARLYPSKVVALALLFILKGVGNRLFYW